MLTEQERSVLSRGLEFCPTPDSMDADLVKEDLVALHKRLRLISFSENLEDLAKISTQTILQPTLPNLEQIIC